MKPDWSPFRVCAEGERPPKTRGIRGPDGVGDRLRAAAFAELQAREAFLWGAERYADAPEALRRAWRALAAQEQRHLDWLLARLRALGKGEADRPVSDRLWRALTACADARSFAVLMAAEEERGRLAGERFRREMEPADPESARVFGKIAEEEVAHIELARRFYPEAPAPGGKP